MRSKRKWSLCLRSRYWFLLPSLAGVSLFVALPFLEVVRRSFFGGGSLGFDNYRTVFGNEAFLLAVKNTCRFTLVCLPLLLVLSFPIAAGIYKSRLRSLLKAMYLFPMAVPAASMVLVIKMLFAKNGWLGVLLSGLGVEPVDWLLTDASFSMLLVVYLWKNTGYAAVLWIVGMEGIPEGILEAAQIDGATKAQRLRYIILPSLKPALYTIVMLGLLNSFHVFREAYLVAGAYPQRSMYLLWHLLHNWFLRMETDKISAASVVIAVVFAGLSLLLQKIWEKEKEL